MKQSFPRRSFLVATVALFLGGTNSVWAAPKLSASSAKAKLKKVERELDGRLGVFALNTANGAELSYRDGERFPLCSTFKIFAASAILKKSERDAELLRRVVRYDQSNLVANSPITEKHVGEGMTMAELCAAALRYSDNTAGNLMMRNLGGPQAVTGFARSLGNTQFRLDRWETALNTALPNDARDTSTPRAVGESLERLVVGKALKAEGRAQLREWLLGNTTGAARIKAGIPANWKIGDKTGSGDYGTANDVAVLWPPNRPPIILAIYTTRHKKDASTRNDLIASVARVVVDWLG